LGSSHYLITTRRRKKKRDRSVKKKKKKHRLPVTGKERGKGGGRRSEIRKEGGGRWNPISFLSTPKGKKGKKK